MNRLVKTVLLAGAAWSALSATAIAQQAPAQDPTVTALDEIIVTARRRDEQLKDVPVAVTALSATRLEETGATEIGRAHV